MAAQRTRQASLLRLHGALRAREWDAALALLARDAARCEHQTFESLEASSFRTRITTCIIYPIESRQALVSYQDSHVLERARVQTSALRAPPLSPGSAARAVPP